MDKRKIKGISLIESLVAVVVVGIGFIAVMQISAFSLSSMDRSIEKNKLNFLSEMVMEDMIADPDNASKYGGFNETCNYTNQGGKDLFDKKKDLWRERLSEKNNIKIDNKEKKLPCFTGDSKKTFVSTSGDRTSGRVNFLTGKGERKKFLGMIVK